MARRPFRPPFPWVRVALALASMALIGSLSYGCMFWMPGRTAVPPLPPLAAEEREARERLRHDVEELASAIGERNTLRPEALERAAGFLEHQLRSAGYAPARQTYAVDGQSCSNVEAVLAGRESAMLVVGAHYDSARGSPGANDNATGVAVLLELARRLRDASLGCTVRLLFFVNEEPPYFNTPRMGSRVWAEAAHQRGDRVVGMLSLETIGFFTEAPDSQGYPFPMGAFYPDRGRFLGFIGNVDSRQLVRDVVGSFRQVATLPSEGAALPDHTTGLDWSDHASFWRFGWPALMVTDTALFRYPDYHTARDRPEQVDPDALARAASGLEHVIRTMACPGAAASR